MALSNVKPLSKIKIVATFPKKLEQDLNQVQDNTEKTIKGIHKCPLIAGHVITTTLKSGITNNVNHGMGETILWFALSPNVSTTLVDVVSPQPDLYFCITTTSTITLSLFVFPKP